MSIKAFTAIVLATGLAAAKPINVPSTLPEYTKRQSNIFGGNGFNGAVVNGFSGNGFNFANGFNNFNQQQQVIQIQEQNLQIIDNGRNQQAIVQQVNQVLVVDQVNNGFNNDLNNLFRKSNFQNQFQDRSTVMLVVQEIQVAVDDGRGNQVQQQIFAQQAVVANRGRQQTDTVMLFDSRTLIAQDILQNNAFGNIGQFGGVAGATGILDAALPTKTNGIQLFGARPTWSSVAADPAATLGAIWQQSLQDLQGNENDEVDNKLNEQIAQQELAALQQALQGQQKAGQQDEQKKAEEQKQAEEQAKQQAEQDKQAEQQAQQEEQKKAEEAAKQEGEQKAE